MSPPRERGSRRASRSWRWAWAERASAARIERRLLDRVADTDPSHLTPRPDDGVWQPFIPGVRIELPRAEGDALNGLPQLAPGAVMPSHRHRAREECLVLGGEVGVGSAPGMGPGSYRLARRGAPHAPVASGHGATFLLRGPVPQADELPT